jgi:hypothetical protein
VSAPRFDIVCTTIGDGSFLAAYARMIEEAQAADRVRMVVIPDRKTPAALYRAVERTRGAGISVTCPDIDEQRAFAARIGAGDFFPWDSDNRRNLGYLMSWRDGADIMVSVDDDNLPVAGFLDEHAVVAAPPAARDTVESASGWFNVCDLLEVTPATAWPRGFPYSQRAPARVSRARQAADVAVNTGLWLGDPDVDAITRLGLRPEVTAMTGDSVVLGPGTWTPVNTQNTALRREAIPAYYFVRMGHQVHGRPAGRYGDIYSGYFVQACAKHLGQLVRAGAPLARHERNDHDLRLDLREEFPNIELLDELLAWLTELKLEGSSYRDAYLALSHALHEAAEEITGPAWDSEVRGMIHRMAAWMRTWLRLCDRVGGAG